MTMSKALSRKHHSRNILNSRIFIAATLMDNCVYATDVDFHQDIKILLDCKDIFDALKYIQSQNTRNIFVTNVIKHMFETIPLDKPIDDIPKHLQPTGESVAEFLLREEDEISYNITAIMSFINDIELDISSNISAINIAFDTGFAETESPQKIVDVLVTKYCTIPFEWTDHIRRHQNKLASYESVNHIGKSSPLSNKVVLQLMTIVVHAPILWQLYQPGESK